MKAVAGALGQAEADLKAALAALHRWRAPTMPQESAGELFDRKEREESARIDANKRIGGAYYAFIPLNYLSLGLLKVYHLAGTVLTLGYMDLEAQNNAAYRSGALSYDAASENVYWNLGASAVIALITWLTDGLGTSAAMGVLGGELTSMTASTMMARAMGEGFVAGVTTAFGSDVYNTIAAGVTDRKQVAQFREGLVTGPGGWLASGMMGASMGGGIVWGASQLPRLRGMLLTRPKGDGFEIAPGGADAIPPQEMVLLGGGPGGLPMGGLPELGAPPAVSGGAPASPLIVPGMQRGAPTGGVVLAGAAEVPAGGAARSGPLLYVESGGRIVPLRDMPEVQLVDPHGRPLTGSTPPEAPMLYTPDGQIIYPGAEPPEATGTVWTRPRVRTPENELIWGEFNLTQSREWAHVPFVGAERARIRKISHQLRKIPELDPATWEGLPEGRRDAALKKAMQVAMEAMGVPKNRWPTMDVTHERFGNSAATWDPNAQAGYLLVNDGLEGVGEALGTTMHESRHHYQSWQTDLLDRRGVSQTLLHPRTPVWSTNMPNSGGVYIKPGDAPRGPMTYFNQPVEADAESFARVIMLLLSGRRN